MGPTSVVAPSLRLKLPVGGAKYQGPSSAGAVPRNEAGSYS